MRRRALLELLSFGLSAFATDAFAQTKPEPRRAWPSRPPSPSAAPRPTAVAARPKPTEPRIALVGGELHRPDEPPLSNAILVLAGQKVVAIGADASLTDGATLIDVRGKRITGGLIDPLTRVGVTEIDLEDAWRDDSLSERRPIAASFKAADGYDPLSPLVAITRREGLTSVGVVPTGGLVMGQSAWADLDGEHPRGALGTESLALHVHLDDYALGGGPMNRASALLFVRELFDDARAFSSKRDAFERRQLRELGARMADLEVVTRALDGKLPVVFHVDRSSDILRVLDLIRTYKLRGVVASAAEGWRVKSELAASKVPVIVYPLDDGPRTFTARSAREDNAALLAAAGVTLGLSSGESHNARKLRQIAGNAVRAGLPYAAALAAITDAPARMFGLDDYGAPLEGRLANLAVWSGDPLELSTRCERLFIRGREVSLKSRQTALFEKYR